MNVFFMTDGITCKSSCSNSREKENRGSTRTEAPTSLHRGGMCVCTRMCFCMSTVEDNIFREEESHGINTLVIWYLTVPFTVVGP